MKTKEFEIILQNRLEKIKSILSSKAAEYMQNSDRLYNFKRAATIAGITPEKALFGMLNKHLVSVIDLIENSDSISEYLVNEKIGDLINYLILLEAIFIEKLRGGKNGKFN